MENIQVCKEREWYCNKNNIALCKICQNTCFLWPVCSRIRKESALKREYTCQRKPMFWDILHSAVFDFYEDDSLKMQAREIRGNGKNLDICLDTPKKVFRSISRGNVSETTLLCIVGNEFIARQTALVKWLFVKEILDFYDFCKN